MFEKMLESRLAGGPHGLSSASVSVAVAGHLTLAACLAAATFLVIESVDDPAPRILRPVIVTIVPPTAPPRHPPGGGPPGAARGGGVSRPEVRRDLPPTPPLQHPQQPVFAPETERVAVLDELPETDALGTDESFGPAGPEGPKGAGIGADPRGAGSGDGPGSGTGGAPLYVTGEVAPPELVRKVEPRYPEAARRARLSGKVFLKAVIGVDGSVEGIEVLSATHPVFEEAAIEAVRQWRYTPAHYHGIAVAVYFTVTVNFVVR